VLSSSLFLLAFFYQAWNLAAIVGSITVRVNVNQFATPGENISAMDCCRNSAP